MKNCPMPSKGKPHYLSHVPDHQLSAHTKHTNSEDSMSHTNLMSKLDQAGDNDEA